LVTLLAIVGRRNVSYTTAKPSLQGRCSTETFTKLHDYFQEWGFNLHMNNKACKSLLILAVSGLMSLGAATAQTQSNTSGAGPGVDDPGHPRVNEVNTREASQQSRIANGETNGTLTPGQAAHLENREQHIQNQEKRDMAANGGHLTKGEQRQINHEQNRTSKQIYKDKHSAK
jgi:hypothetical protein